MNDKTLSFTQRSLAEALDNVRHLSDLGPEMIAEQVFAASAQQPALTVPEGWKLVPVDPTEEILDAICLAKNMTRRGLAVVMNMQELESIYRAMIAAAPAAPVALGIDGCGKPLCGGIEFAGGHHPLCQHHAAPAAPEPAPPAQDPGLYAIHYRDNWDGEGDTYYLVAQRAEDGRWLNYESGRELLEYEGDAVLEVWPLTSGTTSDKYRAELYDEVWEQARSMGYGTVTMALAELERLKAAEQPDTVMLAEALKPFADAFEATGLPQYRGADDEHAEFLDENQITPVRGITMRQFRRAWEVLSGKSALLGKEGEA